MRDRTDIRQRSTILTNASQNSSLGWLVDLASSAWDDYHPREGEQPEPEENCLLTEQDLMKLVQRTLNEIKKAARSGALLEHKDLSVLLYQWRNFANDEGAAVKRWTSARLKEDHAVACFASAFTSYSWGQSIEDLVAKRSDRAQVGSLDQIMDVGKFRERLETLNASLSRESSDYQAISRFLDAWDKKDRFGR